MSNNVCGYLVQIFLVTGLMVAVYAVLRRSTASLLDSVVRLPAATQFYLRSLGLVLFLGGLAEAIGDAWTHKPGEAFIEYVWDLVTSVGDALNSAFYVVLAFVLVLTILTAVLRRGAPE